MLASRGLANGLVFQRPGKIVRQEDCVQPSGQRRVDVGLGAVADHPRARRVAGVTGGESAIGGGVLFREDLDGAEVRGQAGARELVALLFGIALGDQQAAVARGKLGQGCSHAG